MIGISEKRDILTPSEKEINYIIELLIDCNEHYEAILSDEFNDRNNDMLKSTFKSKVFSLFKMLSTKMKRCEVTYKDSNGKEVKHYQQLYNYLNDLETKIIKTEIEITTDDIIEIYTALREFIEDEKILSNANFSSNW